MTNLDECVITVPVVGGIFGVGRLATRLKALADTEQIGPWHFGHLDACGSRQDPRRSEAGAASIGSIASPSASGAVATQLSAGGRWIRTLGPPSGEPRS
jgi:hypothetical protein